MAFFHTTLTRFPEPRGARRMADTNNTQPTEIDARRKAPKQPRKRRNFVAELQSLQSRVDTVIRLLTKATAAGECPYLKELVVVVIEELKGES